jgi:hypothetical protein
MKILFSLLFFTATCLINYNNIHPHSDIAGTSQLESNGWITISSDLSTLKLGDSCLTTELELIRGNLTDSIVYLTDSCSDKTLTILAGKYRYPNGSKLIKSKVYQDTVKSISVSSFVGNYEEGYYDLISDSVTTIVKIEKLEAKLIHKDSVRQTERTKR